MWKRIENELNTEKETTTTENIKSSQKNKKKIATNNRKEKKHTLKKRTKQTESVMFLVLKLVQNRELYIEYERNGQSNSQ